MRCGATACRRGRSRSGCGSTPGSLYEKENERGFAHLLEHMSFRASEYVPDGEAKRVWQRLGATFGSDSNAQTTPTQTVYRLDLPSATEASLDESLKILSGMMDKPVIDQKTLDSERPVVLSEQREAAGAGGAGRRCPARDAVRGAAARRPLADRHDQDAGGGDRGQRRRVPRPLVPAGAHRHRDRGRHGPGGARAAGDQELLGLDRARPARPPIPISASPTPRQPTRQRDRRADAAGRASSYAVLRPWVFNNDTVLFNQNRMVDTMATLVMNRRLEQRARAGGSFLAAQVIARRHRAVGQRDVRERAADRRRLAGGAARRARGDRRTGTHAPDRQRSGAGGQRLRHRRCAPARKPRRRKWARRRPTTSSARSTSAKRSPAPRIRTRSSPTRRRQGFFTPARVFASAKRIFQGDATRAFLVTKQPGENLRRAARRAR